MRSCYWPDARDNHGSYSGSAGGFIELALSAFKTQPRNIHQLANIMIEFLGPAEAAVESYFTALQRGADAAGEIKQVLLCGRYCDLFQKREGEWRIAARTVVYDWVEEQSPPTSSETERFGLRRPIGAPHPNDPVYELSKGRASPKNRPKNRISSGEKEP